MTLNAGKKRFRETAAIQRKQAVATASPNSPAIIADHIVRQFGNHATRGVVSGYLAIGDELDVEPALQGLRETGMQLALPVVIAAGQALIFRQWQPGTDLEPGSLRTLHPTPDNPELAPDMLLVPMLAFDDQGYRIGWGGGFYDRTLAGLRSRKSVLAIGVAYAGQRVDKVPRDHHDARLDWIATEAGMYEVPQAT